MTTQNEALLAIHDDIKAAARHVALEWADVVEADDMEQEIAVRLLADNYATTVYELGKWGRKKTLFKIGQQIASDQRVDYEHFSGQFQYSTEEVRDRLKKGALEEVGTEETETAAGDPAVEFVVDDVDVRAGFERLPEQHQANILFWLKADRAPLTSTERKNITRAVDALTHILNREFRKSSGDHDGPGSRQAMTNAKANAITQRSN